MIFRIKFAKYGVVRFIGHLDVMRYFQKVIRRSKLPVSYSQGFSPHQLMSFALPLSVGVTSDGEYMEVEFDDEPMRRLAAGTAKEPLRAAEIKNENTPDTLNTSAGNVTDEELEAVIAKELKNHTTEGFEILDVRKLPDPKPNVHQDKAMALVSAADYLIRVKDGYANAEHVGFASQNEFYNAFSSFMEQERIEVTKKTKKNENVLNLREFVYAYGNGENADAAGIAHARTFKNGMQLTLRLAASSRMNIKPEMVLEAFLNSKCNGMEYDRNAFAFHRMELYMGEKEDLRPLNRI